MKFNANEIYFQVVPSPEAGDRDVYKLFGIEGTTEVKQTYNIKLRANGRACSITEIASITM